MNKMFLFIAVVIVGVLATVLFMNQNTPSASSLPKSIDGTPTPVAISIAPSTAVTSPQQTIPTSVPGALEKNAQIAVIATNKGDITLQLYPEIAPKTVGNFAQKSQSGFYNNLTFHRVEDWVVQGGDPLGNGTGGGEMPVEFNKKPFVEGSLGVASRGDGKVQNDAQFFITKKDASWLNGQYTNFGIVTKGMEVINNMQIGDKIIKITVQ